MKNFICFYLLFCSQIFGAEITGFWKSLSDKTGKPDCIIAIYQYKDAYYGRIIGSFNLQGEMKDNLYTPIEKAPGINGNPYYSGLDFITHLTPAKFSYKGKVIDPRNGKVYDAEVWRENEDLILRGKLLMFGKNKTWYPATKSDFPAHFKMPDTSKFTPTIYD